MARSFRKWVRVSAVAVMVTCHGMAAPALAVPPVTVAALYVADVLSDVRRGTKTGTGYLDDLRLQASLDTEQAFSLAGGKVFVFARAINSGNFASQYSGEYQKVSNIDTMPAVRLYEAWYEQSVMDQRLSLRTGLYDLNTEFDANPVAALFMNASQGMGPDIGQSGRNGPSIFPTTSLAARLAWHDTSGLSVQVAVLDGVPGDPLHPKRTAIKLGGGDGALVVGEIGYRWTGGQLALGAWGYTADFPDLSPAAGANPQRHDNRGVYGFITKTLVGDASSTQAADIYLRVGFAQPSLNAIATYIGAGLVARGWVSSRPQDSIGLAIASARTSEPYRATMIASLASPSRHETAIELTYRAPISPWLTLQPDLQLIIHPGFTKTIRNAAVVGLRFEICPAAWWN